MLSVYIRGSCCVLCGSLLAVLSFQYLIEISFLFICPFLGFFRSFIFTNISSQFVLFVLFPFFFSGFFICPYFYCIVYCYLCSGFFVYEFWFLFYSFIFLILIFLFQLFVGIPFLCFVCVCIIDLLMPFGLWKLYFITCELNFYVFFYNLLVLYFYLSVVVPCVSLACFSFGNYLIQVRKYTYTLVFLVLSIISFGDILSCFMLFSLFIGWFESLLFLFSLISKLQYR